MNELREKDKSRTFTDIKKLKKIMREFIELKLHKKYPQIYELVENYTNDAKYFYDKDDYFTSFGCANYAYGFVDCLLILERKKR